MTTRSTKRHIRATARRNGESYTTTYRKLAAGGKPDEHGESADHLFGVNPNLLLGARVEVPRSRTGRGAPASGVIVAGLVVSLSDRVFRVALMPTDGTGSDGEVVVVDTEEWDLRPSAAEIEEAAKRGEGRCRLGRPLYERGEIPVDVLATVPELRLMRLRPRPGQPPIASRKKPGGTGDLYAVAEAEPIPARSAGDQARQEKVRTCADCGAVSKTPFKEGDDGKYYCAAHLAEANRRASVQSVADQGARAVLWAREIEADPEVVLVAKAWDREMHGYRLRAETFSGEPVADRMLPHVERSPLVRNQAHHMPSWVSDRSAHQWLDRRLIEAPTMHPLSAYSAVVRSVGIRVLRETGTVRANDNFARRYRDFVLSREEADAVAGAGDADETPASPGSSQSAADIIGRMRAVVQEMAGIPLTGDQIKRAKRRPRQPKLTKVEQIRRLDRGRRDPDADHVLLASRLYGNGPRP